MDQLNNVANNLANSADNLKKEACSKLTEGSEQWKLGGCSSATVNEVNTFTNIYNLTFYNNFLKCREITKYVISKYLSLLGSHNNNDWNALRSHDAYKRRIRQNAELGRNNRRIGTSSYL